MGNWSIEQERVEKLEAQVKRQWRILKLLAIIVAAKVLGVDVLGLL